MGKTIYEITGGNYLIVPSQLNWYFKEILGGLGSNIAAEVLSALYQRKTYLEQRLQRDLTGLSFTATNKDIESYTHFSRHSQSNAFKFLVEHELIEVHHKYVTTEDGSPKMYRQVRLNDIKLKELADLALAEYAPDNNNYVMIEDEFVPLNSNKELVQVDNNNTVTTNNEFNKPVSVTDINSKPNKSSSKSKSDGALYGVKRIVNNSDYPGDIKEMICDWLDAIYKKHGFVNKYTWQEADKILRPIVLEGNMLSRGRDILSLSIANGWKDLSYAEEKTAQYCKTITGDKNMKWSWKDTKEANEKDWWVKNPDGSPMKLSQFSKLSKEEKDALVAKYATSN